MYKLKSANEKLEKKIDLIQSLQTCEQINFYDDGSVNIYDKLGNKIVKNPSADKTYVPSGKVSKQFIFNQTESCIIKGPVGSGKSVACWMKLYRYICTEMPEIEPGIIKFKIMVLRNTYSQLLTTTMKTWSEWFSGIGHVKGSNKPLLEKQQTFYFKGKKIVLEIIGFGLDKPAQYEKLKSFEGSAAYFNEFREAPLDVIENVRQRLRWPSKALVGDVPHFFIADSNGFKSQYSWVHRFFVNNTNPDIELITQPPAAIWNGEEWEVNSKAENLNVVGEKYYKQALYNKSANDAYVLRELCGETIDIAVGELVYKNFKQHLHATSNLKVIPNNRVYIGFDVGLSPGAVACQFVGGRIFVLKEFASDMYKGVYHMGENMIIPWLLENNISRDLVTTIYDKSNARDANFASTPSKLLEKMKLNPIPNQTNTIVYRIESVRKCLNLMVDGEPAFLIDKDKCPELMSGFICDYILEQKKSAIKDELITKEIPYKTHPTSDVHDALQNVCMYFGFGDEDNRSAVKEVFRDYRRRA